jgi:transposase
VILADAALDTWFGSFPSMRRQNSWKLYPGLNKDWHGRFPRIWIPGAEIRDHRQLLIHRHKLVQIRTRVKNELQHLILNQGMQKKQKLWSEEGRTALASLPLEPWTDRRRHDLFNLLSVLDEQLEDLNIAVTQVAKQYPEVSLLMSQPGVGAVTALAFVLPIGDVRRFQRSKQVASIWA